MSAPSSRDSIDMTSFKFGGKIKVLGYITNKITTDTNDSTNISPLAQVGIGLNQIMLSFFGQQSSLNIVHPIAIYYESPPPVKRVARDAGSKPALLGCASRRWLSLLCHGKSTLRSLPMAPFKPHCY